MTMTVAWDLKVWLEYGQFYLEPSRADDEPYWDPADDEVEILHRAFAPGIARGRYVTVVVTPHRENFDMDLRVELLDDPPADDLDGRRCSKRPSTRARTASGITRRRWTASSFRFRAGLTGSGSAGAGSCGQNGSMTARSITTTTTDFSSGPRRNRSSRFASRNGITRRAADTSSLGPVLAGKIPAGRSR